MEGGACMKVPVLTNLKNVIFEYNQGRYAGQSIPREDIEETAAAAAEKRNFEDRYADSSFPEDNSGDPESSGSRENQAQQGRSVASLPAPSSAGAASAPSMTGKTLIRKAASVVSSAVKKHTGAKGPRPPAPNEKR